MSAHEHLSHVHLSDDVLIDALYGLADTDIDARVRKCPACASRWNQLRERRAAIAAPLEIGADVLAAQRRNIYRGIEEREEHPWRMLWDYPSRWAGRTVATAATAACLLAIGVLVHHPETPVRTAPAAVSAVIDDAQVSSDAYSEVYSDVYSMEQSFEPSATASLRGLFEADGSAADGASPGVEPAANGGTERGTEQ